MTTQHSNQPQNLAQGGTATLAAPQQQGFQQLNQDEFQSLRRARRNAQNIQQSDGYLAVMACRHFGWSTQLASQTIGLPESTVQNWLHVYDTRGFNGLSDMPPIIYDQPASG